MKLTRSSLKELIRQSIKEIDFEDEEAFKKYQSQHKMRPTTKVNIGGKDSTVGDASSGKGGGMGDKEKAAQQSGGGDVSSLQMKLRDLDPDGNITYPEQDEDGTWWDDNYDNDTTRDGFESEE